LDAWLIASLPLIGVVIGAGLQFFSGRALNERQHLSQLRAHAYADYFKAVSSLSTEGRTASNIRDLADAKSRVCLYGTSRVVAKLAELEHYGAKLESAEARNAVLAMVKEARKDTACGPHPITEKDLELVLFGDPANHRPKP